MADKKISALTAATTPLAGSEVLPIVQGGATVKVSVDNLTVGKNVEMNRLTANAVSGTSGIFKTSAATGSNFVTFNDTAIKFYLGYTSGGTENFDLVNMENGSMGLGNNGAYGLRIETTNDVTAVSGNIVIGTAGKGIDFSAATHAAGMTSELLNDYEEGTWTPTYYGATGSAGSLAYAEQSGKYTKIGRQVTVTGTIVLSNKGSWTGRVQIGGFPFVSIADQFTGNIELRNCTFTGNYAIMEIGRAGSDFARFVVVNGLGANSQIDDTMVANNSGFLFTLTYFV